MRNLSKKSIEFRKRVAANIKASRIRKNLSRLEAALACDINPNYYARIERGQNGDTNMRTIMKLVKGLETGIDEFFD